MMDPIGIIIRKIVDWLSKNALVGVILGFLLHYLSERIKKAKLKVMEGPKEESFRSSKRIVFRVRHVGGSLPAINAICYLDVSANEPLSKFKIKKNNHKILIFKGELNLLSIFKM